MNRRRWLRTAGGAAVAVRCARAADVRSSGAFNILYLHCHDAGRVLGPYHPAPPTPALRGLARRALCFGNAHSGAPTCSPSRAAMLTGTNSHQAGMLGLVNRGFSIGRPEWHLASWLRSIGYRTALAGIQHEFGPDQTLPYEVLKIAPTKAGMVRDLNVAQAAANWLGHRPREPFFLSVGFFWPHRVWRRAPPGTPSVPDAFPMNLPDQASVRQDCADYFSSVRVTDTGCGMVLDALERAGLRDRTIVLFTTDHGVAMPWGKCFMRDAGTGVALMMDYPGNPARGRMATGLVGHADVFPTLCDLAGLPPPAWLQGYSLRPLFENPDADLREEVFSEVNWHAAYEPERTIRTRRWRYVRRYHDYPHPVLPNIDDSPTKDAWVKGGGAQVTVPREELFDLAADPRELRNVIADPANEGVLADLQGRLGNWMRRTEDPLLTAQLPMHPPHGAGVNAQNERSPHDEETYY